MESRLKKAGLGGVKVGATIVKIFVVLCFCFVIFYPLLYMLSRAFRAFPDLYDLSVVWIPKNFTMHSMKLAYEAMDYGRSALITAGISLSCTLLQLVSCAMAGYGFARFKFPGKGLLFAVCLFSTMVPMQMISVPAFMELKYFNMLGIGSIIKLFTGQMPDISGTVWSLWIPALVANGVRGSMYIYIFRQFFRGIPLDLEDAAYIDGAGPVATFIRIIIPNAGAPFLVVFILSMIWYWSDINTVPLFFGNDGIMSYNLVSLLGKFATFNSEYSVTESLAIQQAGALLMILPPLIMFLFLQRFFVESLDKTGLK